MTVPAAPSDLPRLGLGCSPIDPGGGPRDLVPIIDQALDLGYALFDTAELYGTEAAIGEALARRPGARADVTVVSKVWATHHRPQLVAAACERSLEKLGLAELDLLLIHAPEAWRPRDGAPRLLDLEAMQCHARFGPDGCHLVADDIPLAETWGAFERLRDRGLVRDIGVSNFAAPHLRELLAQGGKPRVNQVARTPFAPQHEAVKLCHDHGITLMAHSPLAARDLLAHPSIEAIAAAKSCAPAQVILRWNIERGVIPLPGTRCSHHLAQNLQAVRLRLSEQELATLSELEECACGHFST